MRTVALSIFWLALIWTFNSALPRPFDDWKNTLLYVGGGILLTIITTGVLSPGGVSLVRGPAAPPAPLSRRQPPSVTRSMAILYLCACVLSIALAPTAKYEGLLELARLILWGGLAWVFSRCSRHTWYWLMRLTVVSAAAIGLLSWMQITGSSIWPYAPPFFAPIGHATYCSDFMALALVMAMGLYAVHYEKMAPLRRISAARMLLLFAMILIDIGLALAAKRASLVGLAAAFLLALPLVAWLRRSFKPVAWLAMIGALNFAVIFLFQIPSHHGESLTERFQAVIETPLPTAPAPATAPQTATPFEQATSGRWHAYLTSWQIALQRPLTGWGLGTFRFVYPEFAHRQGDDPLVTRSMWYMHPHNEILHQAVELGLPGVFLFLLGFGYLLYRGVRSLRGQTPEAQVLGITALCGLTVAFVSWQLSTNFLFPISRLFTALCVGIILAHTGDIIPPRRKVPGGDKGSLGGVERSTSPSPSLQRRGIFSLVVLLCTLFIAAYQLSLYCVQRQQTTRDSAAAWDYATWATRLAPGAFDPVYVRATTAFATHAIDQTAPAVEALYHHYPYVPVVLYMAGVLRAQQGRIPEARALLQHALQNDPTNNAAGELLRQISPPEMP